VIGADGAGTAADIAEGIVWAADHGARVINMSFVMSGSDYGVAAALEHARSKGALIVAAAGNNGSADATFPASQPGVVSVTGTDASDSRYQWASYGSWVTLAAPGCSQSTQAGGGYADFCGTSSAAAFASGIAALARSASREAPVEQIVTALSTNAVRVGDFVAAGRVDAAATTTVLSASCCGPAVPADSRPGHPEPHPDRL
jgi:subtilisin family serine protease